jgi:hypothetical protein
MQNRITSSSGKYPVGRCQPLRVTVFSFPSAPRMAPGCGGPRYFHGDIDEVAIHKRALTPSRSWTYSCGERTDSFARAANPRCSVGTTPSIAIAGSGHSWLSLEPNRDRPL